MHVPSVWLMNFFLQFDLYTVGWRTWVISEPEPCGRWLRRLCLPHHKDWNSVACSVRFLEFSFAPFWLWSTGVLKAPPGRGLWIGVGQGHWECPVGIGNAANPGTLIARVHAVPVCLSAGEHALNIVWCATTDNGHIILPGPLPSRRGLWSASWAHTTSEVLGDVSRCSLRVG